MQSHCTKPFKQAFLKNLLLGLQLQQESSLSLHERKLAVKSSADVAMAAARGGGARWSKAILLAPSSGGARKVQRCRRIVIRCRGRKRGCRGGRGDVARRLVRRRTMALRKVIPGGTDASVGEAALLREAMDYVVHLQAQVDVLRRVSQAVQRSSSIILREYYFTASIDNTLHARKNTCNLSTYHDNRSLHSDVSESNIASMYELSMVHRSREIKDR
uniref:Uncharacterized protein n=1 Tax=Avena sativa TaxID=4498 RepID=A0ACD6AB70_AVESA